jgi:endogenous inhibitor of DNA gyrase (YacG/DUF329 family)
VIRFTAVSRDFFFFMRKIDLLPWLIVKVDLAFGGGKNMTSLQKERIKKMRGNGESYAIIAVSLGISENTVKSYCRRNNLGAEYIAGQPIVTTNACGNCGKSLEHTQGSKRKRFCSDKCRLAWWNAHPESMKQKAVYGFVCANCGAEFTAYGNRGRKYCSHACYVTDRFGIEVAR